MRILHTSDWHVGKVLKGRDRHDEHVAVLGSIVRAARDEDVDVVLVAGDRFETAAPSPKAQGLVMRTLMALREDGRLVVAIAGNHDNQALIDAVYRPVLAELGVHVLGTPKRPDSGGTLSLRTPRARGGEDIRVAALPFLSHRYAVPAAQVLLHDSAEHTLDYSRRRARERGRRPAGAAGRGPAAADAARHPGRGDRRGRAGRRRVPAGGAGRAGPGGPGRPGPGQAAERPGGAARRRAPAAAGHRRRRETESGRSQPAAAVRGLPGRAEHRRPADLRDVRRAARRHHRAGVMPPLLLLP